MDFYLTTTTRFLFTFSEDFASIRVFSCDVIEADFYQVACLLGVVGYFCYELVVCVTEEFFAKLNVQQGVVEFFVAEIRHDIHWVLGLVVQHSGFPVSERVEVDSQ